MSSFDKFHLLFGSYTSVDRGLKIYDSVWCGFRNEINSSLPSDVRRIVPLKVATS